ncbi:complement C1q subcomponent subunit C-like isoform X3 [Dicentrarchus labrax]|uniref:complement C1q subcomponent subunit C-like isoform X3 n=1 Tax=Dicentrarchus labrax TaxID=13489 RepID=UPI0021F590B3|nr:complement C1q subcomponent subunit C-like isoform X3 [Dicentrarchus labrax]
MNFTIVLSMLLYCSLILAQDDVNVPETERTNETQSCFPDMCEFLKEFGAMTEKQRVMETRLKNGETRLKDAETRLKDSETRLKDSETRLKDSETRLKDSETRLMDSENQILELKSKEKTMVVFSAAAGGSGHTGPFDTDKTLVYRVVKTNIGNAYSQSTGTFTAPVPGIYYFTFFYNAAGSQRVSLTLMKNLQAVVKTTDNSTSYDGADNGGNAVFLQLQQGDQLYMHLHANSHVRADSFTTTFSALLVRQFEQ